ncbi:MAG: response regulator [bacterium]|nr:response regulator [bacterium]
MNEKILIVDDEPGILEVVGEALRQKDFEVFSAESVNAALKILAVQKIDLLITDIAMPGKNGFILVEEIRKGHKNRNLPVIMLTGLKTKDMVKRGVNLRVKDYLTKPVDFNKLYSSVDKFLGQEETEQGKGISTNVGNLTALVVDDEEGILSVIKEFLDLKIKHAATANSVEEAVNLLENNYYDLIITDISMPEKTGFDLIEWTNENPDWIGVPVIIMTGVSRDVHSVMRAQQLSIDKYLIKPIDFDQLLKAVDEICNYNYRKTKLHKISKTMDERETARANEEENYMERLRKSIHNVKQESLKVDQELKKQSSTSKGKEYFELEAKKQGFEDEIAAIQDELVTSKKTFHEKKKHIIKLKRALYKKLDSLSI